ncbi:MAG: single-stranded DNA-binding protein, partial [Pseudonocardia sp.]|nr:single-stranded DNA-binding protein [Pseudonocardia sp.]
MSSPAIVTGDLTRSAQLSRTSDGTPVVNLTLAENSRRQVEGEWIDGPTTYTDPPGSDLPGGTDRLPVGGHPLQDVVEGDHGVDDVRSLVEHHGFGVLPHGRVGDLRAGGLTGA